MITNKLSILVACVGLLGSCATTAPQELVSAREAYRRVSTGITAYAAPAELHVAKLALEKAELSFAENPDSYRTRDLSYIAERKTQFAEATASIAAEQNRQSQADDMFQTAQGNMLSDTRQDLSKTHAALKMSENSNETTAEQLAEEKAARMAAEKRVSDALAALSKLAAVKEEPRGTVITLSGSVLFASGKTDLRPAAMSRLDQVATVLLENNERNILVEGHTDSQGSNTYNLGLSQRRADAVRNYLVQRGYQSSLIKANGMGEGQPVADNDTSEGRADNRRVEIVIERDIHASN